ncbi:glycosyltransferase family 4 protein [Salinimicrobium sp. TIG7-5_MAKvit]|uniref:glycosyltransferase family 4 protein n=1 Tax=Salinimicrobium sp. TIG7-5_MAKvit TaxID=3121289 RepID=UPI003C6DFF71
MKILQLVTKRQYRGAEVFAANLSRELIELGHEILFVGLYESSSEVLQVEDAINLDLVKYKTNAFSHKVLHRLIRLVKEKKPDIVQCNGSDTLKYMAFASFFTPNSPILYRNISIISKWLSKDLKVLLYRNLFKRISHVTCVGELARENFVETMNFPRDKISVIRRGIQIDKVNEEVARDKVINEFNLNENCQLVMHVGNFSPEKNHIFLIDLFSKLKTSNPLIKLVCVGDGIMYGQIKKEIEERKLIETVFLTGFRKDIPQLLAAADCLVLTSFVEGVPGVILEAAAQYKPAIATNVGGVQEVLIDGETGFLIDNFDQYEFSKKLVSLLNDDALRKKMGEKAHQIAVKEYGPKQNALAFEKLYYQLINKKN